MTATNTKHKDRLFRFIFGNPENLEWTLSLYNALNGSHYKDTSAIELNTIDDAIYLGMKNDISFIFVVINELILWEHQSSFNPNMPIRFLIYIARLYDKYIMRHNLNRYSKKILKLPIPKCVCFYNGLDVQPEEQILRLSDAFKKTKNDIINADIEVKVRMLNINYGKNKKLMEASKPLNEYAWLIETVRRHEKVVNDLEKAFDITLNEMLDDFVLKKFLIAHKAEVKGMFLTEYDEEKQRNLDREEGRLEGLEQGIEKTKISVAMDMLKESFPIHMIKKISKLPEEDILNIANSHGFSVVMG